MNKYRVLWIDDQCKNMTSLVKTWSADPDIDIELVGYELAVDGIKAFDADVDNWDAVILDAQQLYADFSEGTSLVGLRESRDHIKAHKKKVPFFIFTGDSKCMSDATLAALMGQRIYKKGNEQDVADLIRDIHNACDANPERRIREKYAKEISICRKYMHEIIQVALCIENGNTTDGTVFNTMRDIMEWLVKYGRIHGIFSQEVATPANASTYMQMIKNPEIVPQYVVNAFVTCNDNVQNGSHSDDAGVAINVKKHVKEGIAPHLIESTFNTLIVVIDWFGGLPKKEDEIEKLRESVNYVKLQHAPLEAIVKQDEKGEFFCEEEDGEKRLCMINYVYAQENNLLNKRVRLMSMIANNKYPEKSPYPYYSARNIIVL